MSEITILLEGGSTLKQFNEDLGRVMDHHYHIDELFMMYVDWCKLGELFIDDYVKRMYPKFETSAQEEQDEAEDNQVALRNAMINLYCALDRMTPHLDRRRVIHAACNQDDGFILMLVR
ncbi:hypothetical protein D9M68_20080 [compost metagenome]